MPWLIHNINIYVITVTSIALYVDWYMIKDKKNYFEKFIHHYDEETFQIFWCLIKHCWV